MRFFIAYGAMTWMCACLVYISWRSRLGVRDYWGALALGLAWPLILPMMFMLRRAERLESARSVRSAGPLKVIK